MKNKTELVNLPVNINARLTSDIKRNLAEIIEKVFTDKSSMYQLASQEEKEIILEAYRKHVGYNDQIKLIEKVKNQIITLQATQRKMEDAIGTLGLTLDGFVGKQQYWNAERGEYIKVKEAVELQKKLDTIEANAPSQQYKNKLLTRLYLATTIGEANTIMREIVGNEIIPSVNPNQLTYTKE